VNELLDYDCSVEDEGGIGNFFQTQFPKLLWPAAQERSTFRYSQELSKFSVVAYRD